MHTRCLSRRSRRSVGSLRGPGSNVLLVVSTRYHPRDPLLEQGQLIQFGRITHFTQLMGFDFSSFGLGPCFDIGCVAVCPLRILFRSLQFMAVLLPFCDSLPFPPRSQLQPSSTGAPSRQSSLLWRSYALSLPPKNFPNCLVFPLQSTLQYKKPPLCVSNPRLFLIEVTTIHAASPKAFPLPPATLDCACARHHAT